MVLLHREIVTEHIAQNVVYRLKHSVDNAVSHPRYLFGSRPLDVIESVRKELRKV